MAFKRIKDWATSITAFRTGDVIPVDGPSGTAKMGKYDLLKETAQNALAGNVAPEFDETGATTYLAGTPVSRGGKTYVFKVDHSGAWNASNVVQIPSSEGFLKVCRSKIIQGNYTPSSLDNLKESFVYIVQRKTGLTTTGFPSDAPAEGIFKLSVVKSYSSGSDYQVEQELKMVSDTSKIWRRVYNTIGSSWSAWTQSNFALNVENKQIMASWNKNLSDLNNAPINSLLKLTVTSATTTLNIPSDFLVDAANTGELKTCKCYYSDSNYRIYQELVRESDGAVWYRIWQSNIGTWGSWNKRSVLENIVTIGTGKQYETLREGITAAYDIPNCKVLVYPKVYDLAVECADILSETMTENFTPCPLGNGMHIIFFDGAYVKANIDQGDMSALDFHYVQEYFEPFGSRVGSFTIENLNLESRNTRYGIHDDHGSAVPCVRKFINCHMVRTSGNTAFKQNIGGGLSGHESVVIEGGTYKTIPSSGNPKLNNGDIDYCQNVIGYHNASGADSDNSITVKDVLFEDKGFLDILSNGASTTMSRVYVSNCKYCYPPLLRYSYKDDHDNIEITALWNNEQLVAGEWVVNPDDKSEATFVPSN